MLGSIKKFAKPFETVEDFDSLINHIGDSKYVLLGEASHGTSEFYTVRAQLTKRLIEEKGFSIIAVEGDWPSCQSVNRYIKGIDSNRMSTKEVMEAFNRWPIWMWANQEIVDLIDWLKVNNQRQNKKVGFYGLDVYSLWESMDEIIQYLEKSGSSGLNQARRAFECFEPFNRNNETYAVSAGYLSDDCIKESLALLAAIQKNKWKYDDDLESSLNMEVNALVTANAEKYYRTMVTSDSESWNVRDRHMVEALNAITNFYGEDAKVIIWEHNTHVGDARATDMKKEGMVNVGQIVREQNRPEDVFIIGFGTNSGTVISSEEWGADFRITNVPPAQTGSWENLMHRSGPFNKFLVFTEENKKHFNKTIGHRAIGVVYRPEYEQYGNYVPSVMSQRYDGFIYIDKTNALHPLMVEEMAPN
jgi:erythromycin esterase-like protein